MNLSFETLENFAEEPGSPHFSSSLRQPHGQTSLRGCEPFFFLVFTTFAGSLARNGLRRRRQRKLVGRCVNIAVFMMNSNGFGHILGWWYASTYVQAVYLFRYTFQMGDSGQSARQLLVYFVVAVISTVAVSFNNTSFF